MGLGAWGWFGGATWQPGVSSVRKVWGALWVWGGGGLLPHCVSPLPIAAAVGLEKKEPKFLPGFSLWEQRGGGENPGWGGGDDLGSPPCWGVPSGGGHQPVPHPAPFQAVSSGIKGFFSYKNPVRRGPSEMRN